MFHYYKETITQILKRKTTKKILKIKLLVGIKRQNYN